MKRETVVIGVSVMVVVAAGIAELSGKLRVAAESPPPSIARSVPTSLGLAALDHETGVPLGAETPYRLALRRLTDSCRENEREIAEMAIEARGHILAAGGRITVLELLESAATIAPSPRGRGECATVFIALSSQSRARPRPALPATNRR